MTGFIRGLFGGKKNTEPSDVAAQSKGAYYLSADDAKSFGDIDYMRKSKTVRRTFARKKGQTEEIESIKQISALGSTSLDKNGIAQATGSTSGNSPTTTQSTDVQKAKLERRKPDSSMDTFRNMARDIKK